MSTVRALLFALVFALSMAPDARAVLPDEMLADPVLEQRAEDISKQLRCVVCQNQTIDDSNAPLAHDMRLLVRERLVAGDTDQQVVDYIVARYGHFVLLRPPFEANTWALWAAPFVVLLLTGGGLLLQMRGRPKAPAPLSSEERRQLQARLGSSSQGKS